MKITKLHLKKFKVFDDLLLDFTDKDGQPLNQIVLAGLNGTGKTTILEALKGILTRAFESKKDPIGDKLYAELKHKDKKIKYENGTISVRYEEDIYAYYRPAKIRNEIIRKENFIPRHQYNPSYYQCVEVIEISYENEFTNDKNYISRTGEILPNLKPDYVHLDKGKIYEIIPPLIQKILEQEDKLTKDAKDYEIAEMNSIFKGLDMNSKFVHIDFNNLFFESANGQQITFEELSSGEKQLYFMGFMLKNLNINNTIIMIDEPEDSLHPKWQSQLLQFYSNIGENNQVILATHSPHIIGSAKAESVFLLKNENGKITTSHPKYSEGHSIPYVLSEIMDVDYRDTYANDLVDQYLTLIRKGEHENEQGKIIWKKIEALNLAPNSEEQQRIDLSLRRFKAIGR